ncbi:MAG TPA: DMT family transporter [Sphingomicrobium sp.]|nr:DMT family transporter [Sphingomicrobium sp.]
MNRVVQHPLKAFAAALIAVATLSIMDAVMKGLVIAIGILAVSVWRAAANFLISAGLYLPSRRVWPSPSTLRIHLVRSVIVTLMAGLFFWGIGRVPLAQAIALTFIAPLIALLLAAAILGEEVGRRSIAGSLAAFGGVVVIVIGQARAALGGEVLMGSAAIVGSALCYAINIVMMRQQALAAKPLEINFFQSLIVGALWLAVALYVGLPSWPSGQWQWVVIAATLSTIGGLVFSWAYARAEASYLAVTEYSAFLWASALGWLIFRERLSLFTLAGAALIVAGSLIAVRRDARPEIEAAA